MNRIDSFNRFKKYFEKNYSNFEEMNTIFSFRRYFLSYDIYFEEEDFNSTLYLAIRNEVNILLNYFVGLMNINPTMNDISRIDYEFISNKLDEINLLYVKLYTIEKQFDLFLLTNKPIELSLEEITHTVREAKTKLDEILTQSVSNLDKELKNLQLTKNKNQGFNNSIYQ